MSCSFFSSTTCRANASITANDMRLVLAVSVDDPTFRISFFFISRPLSRSSVIFISKTCSFYHSLICPFPYTNHLLVTSPLAPNATEMELLRADGNFCPHAKLPPVGKP